MAAIDNSMMEQVKTIKFLPQSIVGIKAHLRGYRGVHCKYANRDIILIPASRFQAKRAKGYTVDVYDQGGSAKGSSRRERNFRQDLPSLVEEMEPGEYVVLNCRAAGKEDVIILLADDAAVLSDIYSEPAELFENAGAVPDEITAASLCSNLPLVLDAACQYEGRGIQVRSPAGAQERDFMLVRLADYQRCLPEGVRPDDLPRHEINNVALFSQEALYAALEDADRTGHAVLQAAGYDDYILVRGGEEPGQDLDAGAGGADAGQGGDIKEPPEPDRPEAHRGTADPVTDGGAPAGPSRRLKWQTLDSFAGAVRDTFTRVNNSGVPEAVRDSHGDAIAVVVPVSLQDALIENIPAPQRRKITKFAQYPRPGLREVQTGVAPVYIEAAGGELLAILLSGDHEHDLARHLPTEQTVPADDAAAGETAKRAVVPPEFVPAQGAWPPAAIKETSFKTFHANPQAVFERVNKSLVPEAVKGRHGTTIAVILPVGAANEIEEKFGPSKHIRTTTFHGRPMGFLDYVCDSPCPVFFVDEQARKLEAVLVRGEHERALARHLTDQQTAPTVEPSDETGAPQEGETDSTPTPLAPSGKGALPGKKPTIHDVVDCSMTVSGFVKNMAKKLREINDDGRIMLLRTSRGAENPIILLPARYADAMTSDPGIDVRESPATELWRSFEQFRKAIGPDQAQVVRNLRRYSNPLAVAVNGNKPSRAVLEAILKEKTRKRPFVPAKPAGATVQEPRAPAPEAVKGTPDIDVGTRLAVDLNRQDIAARLKAIAAEAEMAKAVSRMWNELAAGGFVPVTVGGARVFVTSIPEIIHNLATISRTFGIRYKTADITADGEDNILQSWSSVFRQAASDPGDALMTLVADPPKDRQALIIADHEKTRAAFAALEIELR